MNKNRLPPPLRWGRFRYGTSWTTTTTPLSSQWGLLINIDSATGDIPQTASGWIESDRFWFYNVEFAGSTSWEFDTAVTRTGNKTLKLSTLDATGRARAYMMPVIYGTPTTFTDRIIPCKVNTKYIFSCWVKTTNVVTVDIAVDRYASGVYSTSFATPSLTWTNDWTRLVYWPFTTSGVQNWLGISFFNNTAWNISDAWFDINSMTLEEVIEPVANSLVTPSPSLVSFTAVGTKDTVDQSFTTTPNGWSAVGNAWWLQYLESQSFTPTKRKHVWVYFWKRTNTGTPTGDFKIDIRSDDWSGNPSWTILASTTVALATYNALSVNAEYFVSLFYSELTPWTKYHYVVSNTATEASWNYFNIGNHSSGWYTGWDQRYSSDWGSTWTVNGTADVYFKSIYYRPTTSFTASQNNLTVNITDSEYGFLESSVINVSTGTFTWNSGLGSSNYVDSLYSASSRTVGTWNPTTANRIISWATNATLIYRLPAWLSWTSLTFTSTVSWGSTLEIASSIDWVSYTVNSTWLYSDTCSLIDWARYLRLVAQGGNCKLETLTITSAINTTSYSVLKNYPTNKDIIKQYSTTLGSATTSATYRATKWGFPAIEFSSTEYQFLDVDTTATGSTVAFSELWTTYTTVADGASLAISSTSNPTVYVKSNITANRIYVSSNDYNSSNDRDWSHKQVVTYQVKQ